DCQARTHLIPNQAPLPVLLARLVFIGIPIVPHSDFFSVAGVSKGRNQLDLLIREPPRGLQPCGSERLRGGLASSMMPPFRRENLSSCSVVMLSCGVSE